MKKKPKVIFNPIEGSAPLSIYWSEGPYGDAKEAKDGNGVYWVSSDGLLLGVQFDDVHMENDSQVLTLPKSREIHVKVVKGKVNVELVGELKAA